MKLKSLIAQLRDIASVVGKDAPKDADIAHEAANDLNDLCERLTEEGISDPVKPKKKKKSKK